MSDSASRSMRCPLCGFEFAPAGLSCHSACPLGSRCNLACCPNCGYEMPDESGSRVARWLRARRAPRRSVAAARARRRADAVPMTHVGLGVDVRIRSLDAMPTSRRARLGAFGAAPGGSVRLVQRRPVPVIRIGETDLALSAEILDQIMVEAPEPPPSRPRSGATRASRRSVGDRSVEADQLGSQPRGPPCCRRRTRALPGSCCATRRAPVAQHPGCGGDLPGPRREGATEGSLPRLGVR